MDSPIITRFAPSPTGNLHLGHALAAWEARSLANRFSGKCVLRMEDIDQTRCRPEELGDVILGRKDCAASYHIAVVVDDAAQGVTHVSRGEDLFPVTGIHRTLQALLGLPVPQWYHHRLVKDASGKRLAKRDRSLSLQEMRAAGMRPEDVFRLMRES